MGFVREILDDLPTQRLQENVARQFSKGESASQGCIGGTQTNLGNFSYQIDHSLGKIPKEFIIVDQSVATSILAELVASTGTNVTIKFSADPGTFKVFLR